MRPEGWNNPWLGIGEPIPELLKLVKLEQMPGYKTMTGQAFEAGADAILEALKKSGVYTYGNHTPDIDLDGAPEESGYWCFIPQEVE